MPRQSLGSPSSKLQRGGVIVLLKDDSSSSASPSTHAYALEEEKLKKLKPKPELYIHFIPMLTLLCLLILYLSSHNPSPTDSADFSGHKYLHDSRDSREDTQKPDQILETKQRGMLAVSWKNRRFLRRKMADF